MSIHSISLHFLLAAHGLKSINGKYLNIGKQTVAITQKKLLNLGSRYGYKFNEASIVDTSTRKTLSSFTDDYLLANFSKAEYHCLDKSDYETANEIVDLNADLIPSELEQNFDFIYDGGTLDNVFNPAQAIKNIAKMLRPGGRVLHFNVGSGWPGAYCSFSCEWFFSYYSANNFADVRIYLVVPSTSGDSWPDPAFHVYSYSPYFNRRKDFDPLVATRTSPPLGAFILCLAERSADSSIDKVPTQSHYLEDENDDWRVNYERYQLLKELPLCFDMSENLTAPLPYGSDHYQYLGVLS